MDPEAIAYTFGGAFLLGKLLKWDLNTCLTAEIRRP